MWPLVGAALGVIGDIWSAESARSGQRDANRANLQIAREQMGFQERMSNTSWQRSVADMKAAGINPMLAFMKGGASTPPGATARMESETAASSHIMSNSASKAIAAMATQAQIANVQASTRKANAEASLIEAEVPFSAGNAHTRSLKLTEELTRLGQDIEKASYEIKGLRMTTEQMEKMMPLLLDAQRLVNQGMRLQMSKKELESNVADFLGIPFDYGARAVKYLNQLGSSAGISAAEAREFFMSLPEKWREMRLGEKWREFRRPYYRDQE